LTSTVNSSEVSSLAGSRINLVKVFAATTAKARAALGDQITAWLADNPAVRVIEAVVNASSDREYHCLSIVLLCDGGASSPAPRRTRPRP
jgi:hypothetical protein